MKTIESVIMIFLEMYFSNFRAACPPDLLSLHILSHFYREYTMIMFSILFFLTALKRKNFKNFLSFASEIF